ncbi:hypothetical protein AJ80_01707 [Polytolypa hystricis UAMH7299]|uniref:Mannose-1-phosphate guanyltransferase n=1 Tax=Polytolypa hystricis (strain UAMH7299) TaxID=1447883 RepID=A0A2B7Z0B5_POLH7|nr:hypothetical protein AJ80_01707 [Polytolypa hystricis UAMH7299]
MPPRSQRGGGSGKQKASAEDERADLLQAVVLADTFETRFEPFTLEVPRCLLPLANTPLIEYTLEFLANAGVEEVFLYGGAHSDLVEKYINASKWKAVSSPFKKFVFLKSTSASIGDIMRDLHAKDLMTGDFIVVNGDVVSNLPIEDALSKHRTRRVADKNAIMTMILREVGMSHRTRPSSASPVFFIDPTQDRCLHYEEMQGRRRANSNSSHRGRVTSHLTIEPELLAEHAEIDIRHDLLDCRIDICTPEVLGLWADSFDYQTPREQFLYGVLKDYELNGKTIHTYIVKDSYATRVGSLRAYDSVSKDILARFTYPFCPETNLLPSHTYTMKRCNVYLEQGVMQARSAVIGARSAIGQDTTIGERTVIKNSVIGRRCRIGNDVVLEDAYLWDDVAVGDGTQIRRAIAADKAVVGERCRIEPGSLLSFGVKIANGVTVQESSRITKAVREGREEEDKTDTEVVGAGGEGYEFVPGEDEEDESDVESVGSGLLYNMAELSLSNESISTLSSEISDDGSYDERSRSGSFVTSISDDEDSGHFHHDAVTSIYDGLKDDLSADVVQLELVGLRMSANASEHQVRRAVVTAFLKRVQQMMEIERLGANDAVNQLLTKYKEILDRIVFDRDSSDKPDQVDLLLLIQQDLVERNKGETVLLFMAKELYDLELVEEEAFEQWWADERSVASEQLKTVRVQTKPFIDWLESAESDSEDEDEDEESEDDEKRRACEALDGDTNHNTDNQNTQEQDVLSTQVSRKKSKKDRAEAPPGAALEPHLLRRLSDLATPSATATSASMDSDEEFMSNASSQGDFLDTQGSDDESLGEDFDEEDFGGSFSYDKDSVRPKKKPYEVDFKVLSPDDIQREQNVQVNDVSSILGLPPESAAILLRFGRWNREKLIDSYMEHSSKTLDEAGLGSNFEGSPKTEVVPGFACEICCEDEPGSRTYALRCGHRFCVDCYRHYLKQKIIEEGEAARIECPQDQCRMIVDSKSLALLVTDKLQERYKTLLVRTYVDDKQNLKWCPAPNCEYAVDCSVKQRELNHIVPTVHCICGHDFCFGCGLNDHQPPPCALVKKWLKKCKDDSETANWISAHTKECPKCQSTIEKNGGCNHMTCRKCKHEFCWMCMGLWSEHGTSWYNCNRFEEKSGSTARDAQARSRQSLERYLHYYNRYANHEQSAKLDKDLYLKTEKKMMSLQSQSGMSWIEVQFLDTASRALQECRQTLKWTYAFAFYLARNNQTEIFEDNQKDLEMAVESLSEMFEKPISELAQLRGDILDKTSYCNQRRVILLSDTAEKLKNGEWKFNTDLTE